jgi:uncharacterized membrane protein YbaN (DUF454 family)
MALRSHLTRPLLLAAGWMSLTLGIIGIVVPLLPTTPFLLLAGACFARSSRRTHEWLLSNRWLGPALKQWEARRTVTPRVKRRALVFSGAAFVISIVSLRGIPPAAGVVALLGCLVIWRIARLPTGPEEE